jgi:hypothetical protein
MPFGQEPYCGFERHYILTESGLKATMLSGRTIYVIAPLRLLPRGNTGGVSSLLQHVNYAHTALYTHNFQVF